MICSGPWEAGERETPPSASMASRTKPSPQRSRSAWWRAVLTPWGGSSPCQRTRNAGPGSMSMVTSVASSWRRALITSWSNASASTGASGAAPGGARRP